MRGTIVEAVNALDRRHYRASLVRQRKYVTYRRQALFSNGNVNVDKNVTERTTLGVTVEAIICTGPLFLSVMFAPKLSIYYTPGVPARISLEGFAEVVSELLRKSDIGKLRARENDCSLTEACGRYGLLANFGFRIFIPTFRKIPCVFLLDRELRDSPSPLEQAAAVLRALKDDPAS